MSNSYPSLDTVKSMRRIIRLIAGSLAFLLYAWFAAVRSVPRVKRRKAARRAR
jgi:hypothetical protein